jgi:hypothetical protein
MKKFLVVFVVLAMLLSLTVPAMAAKPDVAPGQEKKVEKVKLEKEERFELQKEKENGAIKYEFFLSGDVMPSPPYGLSDVEGSEEKSKLIVNQPNGKPLANVTGILKGLMPDSEYTVYISNGYEPYMLTEEWSMVGDYILALDYNGTIYTHDISITTQTDGLFEGTGGYPSGLTYTHEEIITGEVTDTTVSLHSLYTTTNAGYVYDVIFEIAPDGTLTGTWTSNGEINDGRPLEVTSGTATLIAVGDTGWPGLLTPELPAFTVTTDEEGHVSWHVNILCEMVECVDGKVEFSVWVNGGGATVLISETVVLECDCEPEPEPATEPE